MINIIKRVTASAIWDIDGVEVKLKHRKEYSEKMMIEKIKLYQNILSSKTYLEDNTSLCEAFQFFGGSAFVAIGMTKESAFKECFLYYARVFAKEWAKGKKCLKSKFVGVEYVFEIMCKHSEISIQYNFRYILDGVSKDNNFPQLVEQAFMEYWSKVMVEKMNHMQSVSDVATRVGDARVSRYFMFLYTDTKKYLENLASNYTDNREIISKRSLSDFIFGNGGDSKFLGMDQQFYTLFSYVVEREFCLQKTKLVATNYLEFAKDSWKLYMLDGVTLKYMLIDFRNVNSQTLRQELKHFLKFRYSHGFRTNDRNPLYLLSIANMICYINPNIKFFADIDVTDAKALQLQLENDVSQVQMMNYISMCNVLFDFLESDDNTSRFPKPYNNPFRSLKMVNAQQYNERTPYIPDDILAQIEQHIDELSKMESRMFQIFAATGMRAKEVVYLKEDCLLEGRYDKRYILKYIPYKVLNARRKLGIGEYHQIYVDQEIKELIEEQISDSEELRKQSQLPYIFLYQKKGRRICLPNTGNYSNKINKLIQKHDICDESGTHWNFTTRQCRKTLVVKMIENNATVTDLVYQLGHLNHSTVMKYYADVKAMKLVELNTEFYQKQFGLLLSEEQLVDFSEEERKQLYVDFRLSKRRVEFGYCMRKNCEGACSYQSKTMHCVSCPNLCTGIQYLSYWSDLLKSQKEVVDGLKEVYHKEDISDYEDFTEYILEKRKLLAYQNIVKEIKGASDECSL